MSHLLDGPRQKVGRAEADLDELEAEIARFLRRDSYEVAQHFDPKTGRCTLTFVVKHRPPLSWSVTVGDIAHNLRSALDHLACALFLRSGGADCTKPKTSFPILIDDSDVGFAKWLNVNLPGLPADAIAELKRLQPYSQDDPLKDPLAILNRLSNQDKHRLLVPVFSAMIPGSTGMIGYREMRDVDASPQQEFFLTPGPLGNNAPLAQLDFPVTGPDPYVEVEPHFPIDIAFGDGGPVITILRLVGSYVSTDVFNRFLQLFPPIQLHVPEVLPPPRPMSA